MMLFICHVINEMMVTAPFNNMRTLKFEAQLTNGFFAEHLIDDSEKRICRLSFEC